MLSFGQSLVSVAGLKPRKKFHFDVVFNLQDLLNCTYVSGVLFAKIGLKDGGHFLHMSQRVEVHSHTVSWDEELKFPCKLYANPNTAELEPCFCKVSIRKESGGGKSYKKLGFVRVNLAEFAGAGIVQRKYLLESYNEHKHKPDNSILRIKVMLKQTSGDVLFKAPRPPVWEISEPDQDEGIQADLQTARNTTCVNIRASTASTFSGLSTGSSSSNLHVGSSLQDMRNNPQEQSRKKSSSACSLRGHAGCHATDTDSSEYDSANHQSASSSVDVELHKQLEETAGMGCLIKGGLTVANNKGMAATSSYTLPKKQDSISECSSFVDRNGLSSSRPPVENYSFSYPRFHRRETSDTGIAGNCPPLRPRHRRIQSLSISGYNSRPVSTHSAQSDQFECAAVEDTESLLSCKTRVSVQSTSSRVEHSRVDTNSVIDELLQGHDLRRSEEDEEAGGGGLKIYVDRNRGDCVVAGPDLERRFSNLKPIDMSAGRGSHHSKPAVDSTSYSQDKAQTNDPSAHV